jgi:hypothetical protein
MQQDQAGARPAREKGGRRHAAAEAIWRMAAPCRCRAGQGWVGGLRDASALRRSRGLTTGSSYRPRIETAVPQPTGRVILLIWHSSLCHRTFQKTGLTEGPKNGRNIGRCWWICVSHELLGWEEHRRCAVAGHSEAS